MGTKLRKISTNIFTKIVAFIVIVAAISGIGCKAYNILSKSIEPSVISSDKFVDWYRYNYLSNIVFSVANYLNKNEEGIHNKAALTSEIFKNLDYYILMNDGTVHQTDAVINGGGKDKFFTGSDEYTMTCEDFGPSYINFHKFDPYESSFRIEYTSTSSMAREMYGSLKEEYITRQEAVFYQQRTYMINALYTVVACALVLLLMLIYFVAVTGKKPKDSELHLCFLDKIYLEIMLSCCFFAFFSVIFLADSVYYQIYNRSGSAFEFITKFNSSRENFYLAAAVIVVCAVMLFLGMVFLSFVRRIRAKTFFKCSILYYVYKILCRLLRLVKRVLVAYRGLFDGSAYKKFPLTKRLFYTRLAFILGSAFLVMFTIVGMFAAPLFIIPILMEIGLIYWFIVGDNKTYNDINQGFDDSIGEQMKAERMKINLVTNVSHDLKTPLTSIISYVDLLSKEEGLSETAHDYIKILGDKSERLKHIVADLFDLAKATSGNIDIEREELDVKKLIEQTLADMQDKITASGLDFKITLPPEPVNITSDGKKLYRVFQNIIDNALKFSLAGTRVYIDLTENATATIKNTAAYEMDFTAQEILARFNRGDKSRSTDGTGLGLSIAESFVQACGGKFDVVIDGDLFKVIIALK